MKLPTKEDAKDFTRATGLAFVADTVKDAFREAGSDAIKKQLEESRKEYKLEVRFPIINKLEPEKLEILRSRLTWVDYRRLGMIWWAIKSGGVYTKMARTDSTQETSTDEEYQGKWESTRDPEENMEEEFLGILIDLIELNDKTFREEMDKIEFDKDAAYYARRAGEKFGEILSDLSDAVDKDELRLKEKDEKELEALEARERKKEEKRAKREQKKMEKEEEVNTMTEPSTLPPIQVSRYDNRDNESAWL